MVVGVEEDPGTSKPRMMFPPPEKRVLLRFPAAEAPNQVALLMKWDATPQHWRSVPFVVTMFAEFGLKPAERG